MLSLLASLLVSPALAAGYYYPDSGVVANGRGCAFVAGADTQFAQYYNPAGLIRIRRFELSAGASGVMQRIHFDRIATDPDTGATSVQGVDNLGGMFAIPEGGVAGPLTRKAAFAIGFTSPFSPDYRFTDEGPQRYSVADTVVWNFFVGPSFAYQPVKQLTIGVGLQWQVLRLGERIVVTTSGDEDPRGDVLVDARVWDRFTPGVNAGLLLEPVEEVTVGLSVQPRSTYDGRGHGYLDFEGHGLEGILDQTRWEDDDILMRLQMPWFVRSGVAVRPIEGLEVEADFIWEGWKSLEDIRVSEIDVRVTGGNGFIDEEVADSIDLPAGFRNAWSVRLGGEYAINDVVEVRAGGFYERSALPAHEVSVALVDTDKWQLGTGTSVHLLDDRLVLDAYVSTVRFQDLVIRDSDVTQINVYGGPEAVVGNGDITSWGLATGAAARWRFGVRPPVQ